MLIYNYITRQYNTDSWDRTYVTLCKLSPFNELVYDVTKSMHKASMSRLEYDYLTKKIETDIGIVYGNDLLKGWW